MKITIDTDELAKLKVQAETIKLEPEAEEVLARILELDEQVSQLKETAKAKLLEEGRKLSPDFKSWEADTVRVSMRAYGAKYYVSDTDYELAPKELYKTVATVIAPNEGYDHISEALEKAGFTVDATKGKDGEKLKINRVVDTKAVAKWEKQHRGLPTGIVEVTERPTSLTFSLKSVVEEVEE